MKVSKCQNSEDSVPVMYTVISEDSLLCGVGKTIVVVGIEVVVGTNFWPKKMYFLNLTFVTIFQRLPNLEKYATNLLLAIVVLIFM